MTAIKGHCACGKVSYESAAEPAFTGICHCKSCQRQSGSAFAVVIGVPTALLTVSGEPKTYASKGDSGKEVVAKFCPDCGSTILSEPEAFAGMSIVRAGTLDDTSWLKRCSPGCPWAESCKASRRCLAEWPIGPSAPAATRTGMGLSR